MSASDRKQGITDAANARAELYDTLGQLKDRLNYAKRFDDAVDESKQRIAETKQRNPLAFAAGVAGVAATAGLTVWAVAAFVARKVS